MVWGYGVWYGVMGLWGLAWYGMGLWGLACSVV